jgi:hypothetical protein
MSYDPYDEIQNSYFSLVSKFLSQMVGKQIFADVNVEDEDIRKIRFTSKDGTDFTIKHDVTQDGSHTKPWTEIAGNEIGREPIWGIDDVEDEDDLDEIDEIIFDSFYEGSKTRQIKDAAKFYLELIIPRSALIEKTIKEATKRGFKGFVEGAHWYAEFIQDGNYHRDVRDRF